MSEMCIVCPLCSQPGFPDVNSLWLTLIRATTHQLSCPVCQEVLFGLDKLTIHLVSHSLHDQLVQACLTTNLTSAPAVVDKSREAHGSSLTASQETIQTASHETKVSAPVASYVLINFPSLENVPSENGDQISVELPVETNVIDSGKSVSSLSPQDSFSTASSHIVQTPEDTVFTALLNSKSNNIASAPSHSLIPQNVTPDVCDRVKFITPPQHLYRDEGITTDGVSVVKEEEKPFMTESSIISKHCSSPQCRVLSQGDHSISPNILASSVCTVVSESTSNNIMIEKCNHKTEGLGINCEICSLSFKDNNIAILHQQLIHNLSPSDTSCYQLSPKHDDRMASSKQWLKRGTTASQNREASSPLHRFPCHICNKVFRMRGSLMVHLRVAHSPNGTVGLGRLSSSSPSGKNQIGDVTCKLSLQALSIEEAKMSSSSGENVCSSGNNERRMSDQTLFDHSNTVHVTPNSSGNNERRMSDQTLFDLSNTVHVTPTFSHKVHQETPINVFGSVSILSEKLSPTQSPPAQSTSIESFGSIFPCSLCSKTFSKDTLLTQHLKSHESKQWECDVCFKSFTTKYFLKKHKRLHTGEMPYTCGICNKSFTFQQSYHKHLLYHSDEKPHSCTECGRAFKELSTLHNHQRIHTGEKPWACETCGKCFRQRVSYLVHRRIHTGAMPYQCTVCLKSFRYKVSQRTHKCAAQSTGDVSSQPSDLLHQLLQTPDKEVEAAISLHPPVPVPFKEPSIFLKDQMQQLDIKQEHINATNLLPPTGDHLGNHFLVQDESERLLPLKKCNKAGDQSTQLEHHPVGSHMSCHASQHSILHEFLPLHATRDDVPSKVGSPNSAKLGPNYDLDKPESHGSINSSHLATPHNQSTPPPADFNIDLLQDILSMVMSPSSENAPSPSSQMRHLSLSGGQNDDDLEAGLDLRQLLYGPCDSESTP